MLIHPRNRVKPWPLVTSIIYDSCIFAVRRSMRIIHRGQKTRHYTLVHSFAKYWPIFNFFTVRLSKKLAIKWSLKIPPHLKCVATLPCEILEFKNRSNQSVTDRVSRRVKIRLHQFNIRRSRAYYRDVLRSQQLLPAIYQVSGELLIVQQDSAPARRTCETINLLQRQTPAFISPDLCRLTIPITTQLTTKSGALASLDKSE